MPLVVGIAMSGCSIADVKRRLADGHGWALVRPVVLHLLWRCVLATDLSRPLDGESVLRPGAVVA